MVGIVYFLYLKPIPEITKVFIPQTIVDTLNYEFAKDDLNFAYCLEGYRKNDVIFIENLVAPDSINFTEEKHIALSCGRFDISTIHSHKNKYCKMSVYDGYALASIKHSAMGIICNENKVVFYTPNSLEESIEVEIVP